MYASGQSSMNSTIISKLDMAAPVDHSKPVSTRLAAAVVWTLAASAAAAVAQWLLVIATAKLASAEMVGQLAMSLAIVAPIQALTDLALRPALATDARCEFAFADYLRLRSIMIALFLSLIGVTALLRGGQGAFIILAIGGQKALESASDLCFGLFQREERLPWMGHSVVLRSIVSSLAFLVVMLAYGDLLIACLASLISRLLIFFALDLTRVSSLFTIEKGPSGAPAKGRSGKLFRASLPLAVAAFLMSFTVNIPRYVLEKRAGVAAVGVFAALVYFFQAGAIFIDALGQSACSRLSRLDMLGKHKDFRALLFKLISCAAGAALVGVAIVSTAGRSLLAIAYSSAFAGHSEVFVWLSVCAVPWYCSSIMGYGLVAKRQMKGLFFCQAASLLVAFLASYSLIGATSLRGACLTVFVIYSAQLGFYTLALWQGREKAMIIE